MKIIVTNHAITRLKQRFGLKFYRYTSDLMMLENLIIGQVSTAQRLDSWKSVPFYANKMASTYGPNTEIYLKSGVYFVCERWGDNLVVKTCVEKILCYNKIA